MPNSDLRQSNWPELARVHYARAAMQMLDAVPDVIFTVSYPDLVIGYCNRMAMRFFERVHGAADPRGRVAMGFASVLTKPLWDEAVARTLADGEYEMRHELGMSGRRWMMRVARINDDDGNCIGLSVNGRDITDFELTRSNLARSEGLYKTLFDSMRVGAVHQAPDGRIIAVNAAAEQILGRSADELMNLSSTSGEWEAIHEDGSAFPGDEHPAMVTLRTGQPQTDVYMGVQRPNGELRWLMINSAPVPVPGKADETAVVTTFSDITEKRDMRERLRDQVMQLDRALEQTLAAMSDMIEMRDPYTAGHQRQVAVLGEAIAREMGLGEAQCRLIRQAGLVHDIGKIAIPAEILVKPMRLTALEFDLVKLHVDYGYRILKSIEFAEPIAAIMRQHHERLDGSGYPFGLSGSAISLEARIVTVADVVDSIASHRPYRAAMGVDAALAELRLYAGTWYDEAVVAACARVLRDGPCRRIYDDALKLEQVPGTFDAQARLPLVQLLARG